MNSLPKISIALCTYNGAIFLRDQLDSLVNQTYPNFEIIVVDDCSSDDTIDILQNYQQNNRNIKIFLNESNLGVNESFSKAISLCEGEFIVISDQDDIWLLNKIEDYYQNIQDGIMIYSNSQLIDENGNDMNRRMFRKNELQSKDDPRALAVYNHIAGHTIMFRSALKEFILPIPRHCHYDWWISFVAINYGNIVFLKDSYAMHRVHLKSASGNASLIQQDGYKAMQRWTKTMLSVKKLKHKEFFYKLDSILNIENNTVKKIRMLLFQLKYRNIIFNNKGFLSKINRARKLGFPHIPD